MTSRDTRRSDDASVNYLIGVDLMEGDYVGMRFTLSKCGDLPLSHGLHPTARTQTSVYYLCMGRKASTQNPINCLEPRTLKQRLRLPSENKITISMLHLNIFIYYFFLSTKRSRCSAHLRLTILTAYSWPVCLCLHLLQMEKLPSPSGGS